MNDSETRRLQAQLKDAVKTYNESIGEIQVMRKTVGRLHDRVEQLETENADLREQSKEHKSRLDRASAEFAKLRENPSA